MVDCFLRSFPRAHFRVFLIFSLVVMARAAPAQVCDDGLRCTIDDMCYEGDCVGMPVDCPDDGDACTRDRCSPSTGTCQYTPITCAGPCFTGECDPETGCVAFPNGTPCDDGKSCTVDDACLLGICHGTPVEDDTPCTDSFGACTVNDRCRHGTCVGELRQCPNSDGDLCTPEFCDFLGGGCIVLPRIQCEGPCEVGSCDAESGLCPTAPDDTSCDDGNLCTAADRCLAGKCVGAVADETPTPTATYTGKPSPTETVLPPTGTPPRATSTPLAPTGTPPPTTTSAPSTPTATVSEAPPTATLTRAPSSSSDSCAITPRPRPPSWQLALFLAFPLLPALRRLAAR